MASDFGKESVFNEAALKMRRIDESQRTINNLRTNMLAYNYNFNKHNFEVVCTELLNLMLEVYPKMSDKEKEIANKWRDILLDHLEFMPVFEIHSEHTFGDEKRTHNLNTHNWKELRTLMFTVEAFVREQLEIHGLSSPNQEEEGGWD